MFKNCLKLILMIFKIQITDNYLSNAGISIFFLFIFVYLHQQKSNFKKKDSLSVLDDCCSQHSRR